MTGRRKKAKAPAWADEILERIREADEDEFIEECVYDVLQFGEEAHDVMAAWLGERNWRQRALAAVALARLRGADAMGDLMALREDPHPNVRAALCEALAEAKVPPEQFADFLGACLSDPKQATVVYSALRALATATQPPAALIEGAQRMLEHEAVPVVARAATTLGEIGGLDSVAPLILALHGEGQFASRPILEAIAAIAGRADDAELRQGLRALGPDDLRTLAETLREEGPSSKLRTLAQVLEAFGATEFDRKALGQFGTLLSGEQERGRLAPALLMDDRVESLGRSLLAPHPRSLLLLGPTGAGKTALVHAVTQRLLAAGAEVVEVRAADLIRGKMYIGQWQEHVLQLVEAARRPKPVVVYAPDISEWADAGKTVNTEDSVLSALRPYLERQDIAILAECSPESFRSGLGRHPQFASLFRVVQITPATDADTRVVAQQVLDGELDRLRAGAPQVRIEAAPDLVRRAMELAAHVYSGQDNPGRTVILLRQLTEEVQRRLDTDPDVTDVSLSERDLLLILERQTGISARLLDDSLPLELAEVRRFFEDRIIGQPEAVDAIVDLIALIKAGLTNPERPLSVMLFVGPTGVGKTELARALAEYLFGRAERMVRIDMSEFQDPAAMERLIGRTYGHEGGLLTEPVREQPFCIVLLDEIEKAYHGVHDLLLQVFDSGRLTDSRGRTTSFRRAVIVMTSNLGSDKPKGGAVGFLEDREQVRKDAVSAVESAFRREFVNRFDQIVSFRSLAVDSMERIARRQLERVLSRSGLVRRQVSVDLDPSVLSLIMRYGFSPRYGARPLERAIDQHLLVPIARKLIRVPRRGEEPLVLHVDAQGGASVRVRVVSEARRSAPRVAVADPFGEGKSEKLTADGIRARATAVADALADLGALVDGRGYSSQIAALTAQLGQAESWKDPAAARAKANELHTLEESVSRLRETSRRAQELVERTDGRGFARDRAALARAGQALSRLEEDARILGFELRVGEGDDRCDAFLELSLLDATGPAPGPVETLSRMYEGFARRHHFGFMALYEELDDAGRLTLAELRVEGVSVYGLLRGEEGLHRFLGGAGEPTRPAHVRVRVLPDRPTRPATLRPGDVAREELAVRGPRLLVPQPKAGLRLTHTPTLASVCVWLDEGQVTEALALDLLSARVDRAAGEAGPPEPTVVRRYALGSRKEIRDEPSGLKTGRTQDVLSGHIDPFVLARLPDPPS